MTKTELLQLPNGAYNVTLEGQYLIMEVTEETGTKKISFTELCDIVYLEMNTNLTNWLTLRSGLCGIKFYKVVHHSKLTLLT